MNASEKNYTLVEGDLLESDATYIAHQTNCMSKGAAGGIAKAIFKRFPWANSYAERVNPPMLGQMPGDVEVRGDGIARRYVLNLYAQFHGGEPSSAESREADQPFMRAMWFQQCLDKIELAGFPKGTCIAMPFNIGCGIAGGNWDRTYEPMIDSFAQRMRRKGVEIRLYRKDQK